MHQQALVTVLRDLPDPPDLQDRLEPQDTMELRAREVTITCIYST